MPLALIGVNMLNSDSYDLFQLHFVLLNSSVTRIGLQLALIGVNMLNSDSSDLFQLHLYW